MYKQTNEMENPEKKMYDVCKNGILCEEWDFIEETHTLRYFFTEHFDQSKVFYIDIIDKEIMNRDDYERYALSDDLDASNEGYEDYLTENIEHTYNSTIYEQIINLSDKIMIETTELKDAYKRALIRIRYDDKPAIDAAKRMLQADIDSMNREYYRNCM